MITPVSMMPNSRSDMTRTETGRTNRTTFVMARKTRRTELAANGLHQKQVRRFASEMSAFVRFLDRSAAGVRHESIDRVPASCRLNLWLRCSVPGGSRPMLTKRIIPCLDVNRGRVVKGVQLREPARRGRPGRGGPALRGGRGRRTGLPRHHRQPRRPRHHARRGAASLRTDFHALHGGRRHPHAGRRHATDPGRGRKGESSTRPPCKNPELVTPDCAKVRLPGHGCEYRPQARA